MLQRSRFLGFLRTKGLKKYKKVFFSSYFRRYYFYFYLGLLKNFKVVIFEFLNFFSNYQFLEQYKLKTCNDGFRFFFSLRYIGFSLPFLVKNFFKAQNFISIIFFSSLEYLNLFLSNCFEVEKGVVERSPFFFFLSQQDVFSFDICSSIFKSFFFQLLFLRFFFFKISLILKNLFILFFNFYLNILCRLITNY